jgi:hypothetical protein
MEQQINFTMKNKLERLEEKKAKKEFRLANRLAWHKFKNKLRLPKETKRNTFKNKRNLLKTKKFHFLILNSNALWPKEKRRLNIKKHSKIFKYKTKNSLNKAKHKFKRKISAEQEIRNAIRSAQGNHLPNIKNLGIKTRITINNQQIKIKETIKKAKERHNSTKYPQKKKIINKLIQIFNLREPIKTKKPVANAKKTLKEFKTKKVITINKKNKIIDCLCEVYKNV